MGSSAKKRQTFAKMTRERMVKERRALKQEKKEAKKLAAAAERDAEAAGLTVSAPIVDDEASSEQPTPAVGAEERETA